MKTGGPLNHSGVTERIRLSQTGLKSASWDLWGPYLSERQWGTVREDYSTDGNAWEYLTYEQARWRAYRWGEDGIAGIADSRQQLCFALAFWNRADPVLKERLFGLTNGQGNHGEDVKEYYFYLDSTPTHSYMKYLYKYPHAAYPYEELVRRNHGRGPQEMEFELIDTGIFDANAYFDIFIEYAKAGPEDILISITACNRGTESAPLHLLPTLWFRNTWTQDRTPKPLLFAGTNPRIQTIVARHATLGEYFLFCDQRSELLFTENETNEGLASGSGKSGFAKDGIDRYVVHGVAAAVNSKLVGTKATAHYRFPVGGGEEVSIRLRLRAASLGKAHPFQTFDKQMALRRQEADEFYDSVIPAALSKDEANVMRQALAGMLWTKQFYYFDVGRWMEEHGSQRIARNGDWFHMVNSDVISMPDKWEYPWYAAWDLAFHTLPLAMVDLSFAKKQLDLMLSGVYLHPNGQVPAYEWNFSDVNPPVHAWAALNLSAIEREERGAPDYVFLKLIFHKLLLNFTWWVNRKDALGQNLFQGGFLGLDNIGIFDRSNSLPNGGHLEQADGNAWMAFFSQNMLQISLELAMQDPVYSEMALKFIEHFFWIAAAMDRVGVNQDEMWDEEDGFFYDVLRLPNGNAQRLRLRSMVGLLPLCATTVLEESAIERFPQTIAKASEFITRHPELLTNIAPPDKPGYRNRRLLAILSEEKLRRVLGRMLDENEFLSPYGLRSLSRHYAEHPYVVDLGDTRYVVKYSPADSDSRMFGGNSNWRGPIWFPVNIMVLRAIHQFYLYYGDDFKVECPTGSGTFMTLFEVGQELVRRLCSIFLADESGRRPVYGGVQHFRTDPYWRDLILFYEYFHGDNGAGIGASHQTGWTGLIARLLQLKACLTPEAVLDSSTAAQALRKVQLAA
jgi:Mannosylglycerate hydrolase MGH1-like glycoside hydrolase domain